MTLLIGYCLSFLIGLSGMAGCVLVYQVLVRLVNPITLPLVKKYPFLEKLVVVRILLLLAGSILIPIYLDDRLSRSPAWRPYLMDTTMTLVLGAVLSPLFALLLAAKFGKDKGFRKDSVQGSPVKTVRFSGTFRKTTVSFKDLQVVENPKTGDRYGAGPDFESEYPTAEELLPEVNKSGLGSKKFSCSQCGEALDRGQAGTRTFSKEISCRGMEPFTLTVAAPMLVCAKCGQWQVLSVDELEKAETKACENGRLAWDAGSKAAPGETRPWSLPGLTGDTVNIRLGWKGPVLMVSLAMALITIIRSVPFFFWILAVSAAVLALLHFFPVLRYNQGGFSQFTLKGRPHLYSWDDLTAVSSEISQRKKGLFAPVTTLKFGKKGFVMLSLLMTRDYQEVLRQLIRTAETQRQGAKVDPTTRLLAKGGSLKGRRFPFFLAGLFSFALVFGSFFAFQNAWTRMGWKGAEAQVTQSYVTRDSSSRSTTYDWHLALSYGVEGGQRVEGKTLVEGLYIDDWHIGKSVEVLYDPAQPQKVVLKEGAVLYSLVTGLGMIALGLFILEMARESRRFFHF